VVIQIRLDHDVTGGRYMKSVIYMYLVKLFIFLTYM